jgi:hypothetical protein
MHSAKEGEKRQIALSASVRGSIADELRAAAQPMDLLLNEKLGSLTEAQRQAVSAIQTTLQRLTLAVEKTTPQHPSP